MSNYKMRPNYDRLFGHWWFKSAIDLSVMAKDRATVRVDEKPDYTEAKRLYKCAIADANFGIGEIESNANWLVEWQNVVKHMKTCVSSWEGEIHSMPG